MVTLNWVLFNPAFSGPVAGLAHADIEFPEFRSSFAGGFSGLVENKWLVVSAVYRLVISNTTLAKSDVAKQKLAFSFDTGSSFLKLFGVAAAILFNATMRLI